MLSVIDCDSKVANYISDNYTQVSYLGTGPFSKVFKAHNGSCELVALKVLLPLQAMTE